MASAKRNLTIALIFTALIITAGFISWRFPSGCPLPADATATINNQQRLRITLANTPAKQAQGLGGCRRLPANAGMYFPLDPSHSNAFWMKGMLIPIDIVWIRENMVIGVDSNLPPPVNALSFNLPRYYPPGPADAALEVAAGRAAKLNIDINTTINLQ